MYRYVQQGVSSVTGNTYEIIGLLRMTNDFVIYQSEQFINIYQEVLAGSPEEALDVIVNQYNNADDATWIGQRTINLVTEAVKMERTGQPTLFTLPPKVGMAA
jgi:hypothetical protein